MQQTPIHSGSGNAQTGSDHEFHGFLAAPLLRTNASTLRPPFELCFLAKTVIHNTTRCMATVATSLVCMYTVIVVREMSLRATPESAHSR